ncbi:MAG: hypothetical protein U0932_07890 [Thiobacillus sp.]|nr:hypothetical protein [Thiobacillus sp.]
MLDHLEKLEDIFRELSRGRHLCATDGDLFAALEKHPSDYQAVFKKLGFELVCDARGFYYFFGARATANNVNRLALFLYILIDWLADKGEGIMAALAGKSFSVNELPHLGSERYRGYLSHVGIATPADLTEVIRTMENFGFLAQASDGTFRLLPPAYRIVDACVAAGVDTEKNTEEAGPC